LLSCERSIRIYEIQPQNFKKTPNIGSYPFYIYGHLFSIISFIARHEIDQNDDELKIITASLTRAQANAVRRRIDSLNEAIRQRNTSDQTNSPTSSHKSSKSSRSKQRRHVKDIFQNSDVVMNATSQTSKRM